MKDLSLRFRIFLFFCLSGLGGLAIAFAALWLGFRQLGQPDALSAFVTSAVVLAFGLCGLTILLWLLFDEYVSKPVEAIAANLRVRAHAGVTAPVDEASARYLGDLAPAAAAIHAALDNIPLLASQADRLHVERLERQAERLVQILSDIPIATFLVRSDHRIVLYDGQAAMLMEHVGSARLQASLFDYFEDEPILTALERMAEQDIERSEIEVRSHCGRTYSGHVRSFGGESGYTLMLKTPGPDADRPLTYDFDLFTHAPGRDLHRSPLRQLTFVVFDCETTGLDPETDDVVQLGAVRVVNGKLVAGEIFETLVRPTIPIPVQSTKIHGITRTMVADAPNFSDACRKFHQFSKDAVLVAHNAPFDMAFLHRQSEATNRLFDNPILDTVHMSAVVFGGSTTHTLDALCERLGVAISIAERHTALGDAVATANAFVALIEILQGHGITTFGELQREARKHYRILGSAN